MKTIKINGIKRTEIGKKSSKAIRRSGQVPCVIYGGKENVHFSAIAKEFKTLIYTPDSYLLDITVEGKEYKAILQDVQFHPVSDEIVHLDFFEVFEDKKVMVPIPVKLNGFPIGVQEGGKLANESRKLRALAFPQDFPEVFEIDVTELALGKTIQVKDLSFDGVELVDFPNTVVASVKLTRAAKGAADEDEEGEEGEDGTEGAEGAEGTEGAATEGAEASKK